MGAVWRCDRAVVRAGNAGKVARVLAVLRAARRVAPLIAREQWRLYYSVGRLKKQHRSPVERSLAAVAGSAARVQMVRYGVVGQLGGYLAARQADFRRVVQRSTVSDDVRHQLHSLNVRGLIFAPDDVGMPDGAVIPPAVRRLARRIMHTVMARHRRPDVRRIALVVDRREASVREPSTATHFGLWVRLPTMTLKERAELPVDPPARWAERVGQRSRCVQLSTDETGRLVIGLLTDMAEGYAQARAAYEPRTEVLALDWGLRTLFATDQGDLLGRGFIEQLRRYDRTISRITASRQRAGLRVRSPRYDRWVARLRGYLATEIRRVLHRAVAVHAPAALVVERLRLQSPTLSRRMNRLVSNCGRRVVTEALTDLQQRYGIAVEEVQAAYSSQTCSSCQYPDRRNRSGEQFRCRWCGRRVHADVNAARTLRGRRSSPPRPALPRTKAATLQAQVAAFTAAHPRPQRGGGGAARRSRRRHAPGSPGGPPDPRLTNPHFRAWGAAVTSRVPEAAAATG